MTYHISAPHRASKILAMSINQVKIRMYRHGFGDCFFLQFFSGEERNFTMLIDCGLKHKDKVPGVSLRDVVNDLKKELKNGKGKDARPELDVLVATHEHWDHVSGFHPDEKLFDDFIIKNIWMAWTESPSDKEASLIRRHLRKSVKALKVANEKLKKSPAASAGFYKTHLRGEQLAVARQRFNENLQKVAEFFGPLGVTETKSGIRLKDKYKISVNSALAMEHIKKKLATDETGMQYFYPGDLIELKQQLPGVRIYVLGPPKSALLNKDAPSSGAKKEVYFGLDNFAMTGFINGLLAMGDADGEFDDDGNPFADVVAIPAANACRQDWYKATYYHPDNAWRQIEDDWLIQAGALAMQLDNDTNNTSLALAIELVESGKVLLFPGDAQVGNWLSWHEQEWEVKNGRTRETMTATQLLENTVVYKAGHHLSHNATLKDLGLELMKHPELVVLIPEKQDQYNGIPYEPLLKRIKQKSRGRYIFSADSNHPAEAVIKKKPAALSKEEWMAFKKAVEINKLYVELTVEG